jgi:hypothetical protein
LPDFGIADTHEQIAGIFPVTGDLDYDTLCFELKTTNGGDLEIDWGDGVIEVVAGDMPVIEHIYDFNSLTKGTTHDGTKQCVVNIVPKDTGDSFKVFSTYNKKKTRVTTSLGFLEIKASIPSVTSASFRNAVNLVSFKCGNLGNMTNTSFMFAYTDSVTNISCGDFSSSTSTRYMFTYMRSVTNFSCGDFASSTDVNGMFYGMNSVTNFSLASYNNNIHIKNSKLSVFKLIALLNKLDDLTDSDSKTLTLTGTRGVVELIDQDKQIATDKNWTLVL